MLAHDIKCLGAFIPAHGRRDKPGFAAGRRQQAVQRNGHEMGNAAALHDQIGMGQTLCQCGRGWFGLYILGKALIEQANILGKANGMIGHIQPAITRLNGIACQPRQPLGIYLAHGVTAGVVKRGTGIAVQKCIGGYLMFHQRRHNSITACEIKYLWRVQTPHTRQFCQHGAKHRHGMSVVGIPQSAQHSIIGPAIRLIVCVVKDCDEVGLCFGRAGWHLATLHVTAKCRRLEPATFLACLQL